MTRSQPEAAIQRARNGRYPRAEKAARTSVDGIVFDSKAELRRWEELRLLERAKQISHLQRQVTFPLSINDRPILIRSVGYPSGRAAKYTADFAYYDSDGKLVYEEFKGFDTAESRLRRAVAEAIYDIEIVVTGAAASKTPQRRERVSAG